jgi:hypothetical protein
MLRGTDGRNITGPSLIRVPDWISNRLANYYLYFAEHHGSYIRMAYADVLKGPWTIYAPGTLTVEQVRLEAARQAYPNEGEGTRHIASPDVHVDHAGRKIRMYFHVKLADPYIRWKHQSGVAASTDGINFTLENSGPIGAPYFRVFAFDGFYYAVAAQAQLHRSSDGIHWETNKNVHFAGKAVDRIIGAYPRHMAVQLDGRTLTVFYTRIGDAPERIMASTITLTGNWLSWRLSPPSEVVKPEMSYEGTSLPIRKSRIGVLYTEEHALRDPAVYQEGNATFLLYTCKAEVGGIAIAELMEQPA